MQDTRTHIDTYTHDLIYIIYMPIDDSILSILLYGIVIRFVE